MTTATADPEDSKKRPTKTAPAAPPVPTATVTPSVGATDTLDRAPAYADDPPPAPAPKPPAELDARLVGVGRRLQLLVESSTEHLGEARAVASALRPDGVAYGRMEGLLQAMEYDKEALGRAIQQLHAAAQALAAEQA